MDLERLDKRLPLWLDSLKEMAGAPDIDKLRELATEIPKAFVRYVSNSPSKAKAKDRRAMGFTAWFVKSWLPKVGKDWGGQERYPSQSFRTTSGGGSYRGRPGVSNAPNKHAREQEERQRAALEERRAKRAAQQAGSN